MKNTMTTTTKILTAGLCAGRHEVPVEDYIFGQELTLDPTRLEKLAFAGLARLAEKHHFVRHETEWNGEWDECHSYLNIDALSVYITGFTPALCALVRVCQQNQISLVGWHYNRDTGKYVSQVILG